MSRKFVLLILFGLSFDFAFSVGRFPDGFQFFEVPKAQVQGIKENFGDLFWNYLQKSHETSVLQISSECSKELKFAASSSRLDGEWQSKLRSFAGQFPTNFDKGTLIDFGKYDQCLEANFPISTHYCMASFIPSEEWMEKTPKISSDNSNRFPNVEFIPDIGLTLKVGLCVPTKCSAAEISQIYNHALNNSQWRQVEECQCQELDNREREFTKLQYISIFVIGSLIFLVFRAGVQDIRSMFSWSNAKHDFLHSCFSPRDNLIGLFSNFNETRWKMMDQFRLFSFQIVFLAHIMLWPPFFAPSIIDKFDDTKEFVSQVWTQPIINNYFFEGLIGLGGISSAISIWTKIDKNTTLLKCLRIIISRFLTTQPIILVTIFLEVTVSTFLRGPGLSVFIETPTQACEKNLIHHILHIKTFVGKNIMCAPHFWSLSAEFHLFALAVFFIFLYHRHRTLSKIIMTILTVGGLAYTMSVFYRLSLTPLFFVYPFKFSDGFSYTINNYLTTSTHLWIHVGNVLFFVLMMEKFDEKFTVKQRLILSWIARGLIVLCCFSLAIFNVRSEAPTSQSSAVFIGLLYSGLMFYLFCGICRNAQDGREMINKKMAKRNTGASNPENNHTKSSVDINSNDEKKVQRGRARASLSLIFLRLSKIAYFPSTIVIFTFYATAKEPINLISFNQVKNIFKIYSCILGAAPIFHILVVGPYLQLMQRLRVRRNSMANKKRID